MRVHGVIRESKNEDNQGFMLSIGKFEIVEETTVGFILNTDGSLS